MASVEQSIEVPVPVTTAYNQWTQFEEFPSFMEGVKEIRQLDDTHLHWVVEHNGQQHEFDAEITEQRPDERVAWRTVDGKSHAGVVTFHRLDDNHSKVMVQIDWQPEGMLESVGASLGSDDRRVKSDLERFKDMIESRGTEDRRLARPRRTRADGLADSGANADRGRGRADVRPARPLLSPRADCPQEATRCSSHPLAFGNHSERNNPQGWSRQRGGSTTHREGERNGYPSEHRGVAR